jgi:hypothetical protein
MAFLNGHRKFRASFDGAQGIIESQGAQEFFVSYTWLQFILRG